MGNCFFSFYRGEKSFLEVSSLQKQNNVAKLNKLNWNFITEHKDITNKGLLDFHRQNLEQLINKTGVEEEILNMHLKKEFQDQDVLVRQSLYQFMLKKSELIKQISLQYIEYIERTAISEEQILMDISGHLSIKSDNSFYTQQTQTDSKQKNKKVNINDSLNQSLAYKYKSSKNHNHNFTLNQCLGEQSCQFLVEQCDFMYGFLKTILQIQFKCFIDTYLPTDPDEFPVKEMFLQKVVEHFLYNQKNVLGYFIPQLLHIHYTFKDLSVSKNKSDFKNLTLKKSLIPAAKIDQIYRYSLEYSTVGDNLKFEVIKESLSESIKEELVDQELIKNIPYNQTFPCLQKLIQTTKLWKKFKLINKFDKLIIDLFMRERTFSQQEQLYDTISAEDSKAEIVLFILYKFRESNPQLDLKSELYNILRFMQEYDNVLHSQIKYIFNPSFIRFVAVLELLITNQN